MSKKLKKVCTTLNYIEQFLILLFTITGCVSIFSFPPLFGIPIGITSYAIGLKITVRVTKDESIIKEKKKEW